MKMNLKMVLCYIYAQTFIIVPCAELKMGRILAKHTYQDHQISEVTVELLKCSSMYCGTLIFYLQYIYAESQKIKRRFTLLILIPIWPQDFGIRYEMIIFGTKDLHCLNIY